MVRVVRRFRSVCVALVVAAAGAGFASPSFAQAAGTAYTNTNVPAFTDVANNCIATLGPVLTILIGAGVLVAAVWMVYKVVCLIFGAKPRGSH